jgi:hypothetical protein
MSSLSDQLKAYSSTTGPRSKGFRLGASIDTSRLSQLGCGGRCCKLALMGLSIFLFCAAIGILAGGAYANSSLEIQAAIGNDFTNSIIAFGVILLFISVIGLAGAMRESRMILACFLLIMGLMMIVLLVFGAWALSNLGKEAVILARAWQAFSASEKVAVQNAYTCCGTTYWGGATDTKDCPCPKTECGGCFPKMITDFRNLYTAFGVVFILIGVVLLAGLVTAFCLLKGIASAEEAKNPPKKGGRK